MISEKGSNAWCAIKVVRCLVTFSIVVGGFSLLILISGIGGDGCRSVAFWMTIPVLDLMAVAETCIICFAHPDAYPWWWKKFIFWRKYKKEINSVKRRIIDRIEKKDPQLEDICRLIPRESYSYSEIWLHLATSLRVSQECLSALILSLAQKENAEDLRYFMSDTLELTNEVLGSLEKSREELKKFAKEEVTIPDDIRKSDNVKVIELLDNWGSGKGYDKISIGGKITRKPAPPDGTDCEW